MEQVCSLERSRAKSRFILKRKNTSSRFSFFFWGSSLPPVVTVFFSLMCVVPCLCSTALSSFLCALSVFFYIHKTKHICHFFFYTRLCPSYSLLLFFFFFFFFLLPPSLASSPRPFTPHPHTLAKYYFFTPLQFVPSVPSCTRYTTPSTISSTLTSCWALSTVKTVVLNSIPATASVRRRKA